jgi:ATP-dependent Clp protease ATP-binding subunit ClpC
MFERYTESARRVLFFARYETTQAGGTAIETEHLLLGLIRDWKRVIAKLFDQFQVNAEDLTREIAQRTPAGRERVPTSVEIPFSAETKRVLQFAAEEADRLMHNDIGAEHLLLGLLREEGSVAASILMAHAMTVAGVRQRVVELHDAGEADRERETEARLSIAKRLADRLNLTKTLVEQLGRAEANSAEAAQLVTQIHEIVDSLRPHLRLR